jgi:DNA topoisomerase-1
MKTLVIVESPAKAKTIERFLGKRYMVKASYGHVRDLPKSQLGIDIEADFNPKYITIRGKGDVIKELREAAKQSNRILLATDPDREGEAISWHLSHILGIPAGNPCRITFHEITKPAVQDAITHAGPINNHLVDAQQARRILDRLVGYQLSPLLWKKVKKGLSAGRVQSVAVRMICEREDEIDGFAREEYWSITAFFATPDAQIPLDAELFEYRGEKVDIRDELTADQFVHDLQHETFTIEDVRRRKRKRNPASPFTTSTFQQEASRKLGFSAKKSMMIAQQLYEGLEIGEKERVGLITYMRTDSTRVSDSSVKIAHELIQQRFGLDFCSALQPAKPQKEGVQDAHEAIRPTYPEKEPGLIKSWLSRDQYRVYRLIWERFIASQMSSAVYNTVTGDIRGGDFLFRATGSTLEFPGFMKLYVEGLDDEEETAEHPLPDMLKGQVLCLENVEPAQHFTQPPARYTEATLVKEMEDKRIGRPSTYAPTIETIRQRGYVYMEEKRFFVSDLGRIVNDLLVEYFSQVIDLAFTAHMESQLDKVEEGTVSWYDVVREFYTDFERDLRIAESEVQKIQVEDEVSDVECEKCGRLMVVKWGRFGKFLACPGFPECRNTKSFLQETGTHCPECGADIVERISKKGRRFFGCSRYPDCSFVSWEKPLDRKCPDCGAYMVEKNSRQRGVYIRCSSKTCHYEEDLDGELKDEVN